MTCRIIFEAAPCEWGQAFEWCVQNVLDGVLGETSARLLFPGRSDLMRRL
jgi:hypothetical protein